MDTFRGPLSKISYFLSADVHEVSPLPDTSHSSTSSRHKGTLTVQKSSATLNEMCNSLPPHAQTNESNLQADLTPLDKKRPGEVLSEYEGRLAKSNTDLGYWTTIPFRIQLKPTTALITPRRYRTKLVILK